MKRYYPRFDGKEGLEERYVVVDATTREPVSGRLLYHEANNQAHARNEGTFAPPIFDASLVALFEQGAPGYHRHVGPNGEVTDVMLGAPSVPTPGPDGLYDLSDQRVVHALRMRHLLEAAKFARQASASLGRAMVVQEVSGVSIHEKWMSK